jgi:probable HAF family extracellular repeat protein
MRISCIELSILVLVCAQVGWATDTYTVHDIGTLGGGESRGLSVNNSGQVTGRSRLYVNSYAYNHAYLYDGGTLGDLGTAAGADAESWGYGINASGQIVGWGESATGHTHGFVWTDLNADGQGDPSEFVDIPPITGFTSYARAINDSGQVAGTSHTGTGLLKYEHAYRWTDGNANGQVDAGEMLDLGTLGGSTVKSYGYGINNNGDVVGWSDTDTPSQDHAFVYTNTYGLVDIGTLGGANSAAHAINDSGQVTGYAFDGSGDKFAILWQDVNANGQSDAGEMLNLGTLGGVSSIGYSISEAGDVVGQSLTSTGDSHAFLYSDGTMVDLNDLIDPAAGWELEEAWGISPDGTYITGFGVQDGFAGQAFLLSLESQSVPGDCDNDGDVDVSDLGILATFYGATNPPTDPLGPEQGNFDGDNDVDVSDLGILATNYGLGAGPTATPEPATVTLLALGITLLVRRNRRVPCPRLRRHVS